MRTCVGCRTERAKRELVRVVRLPSGDVVMDSTGKLSGRGAYLCADGTCWTLALRRGALERALAVPLPSELRDRLTSGALDLTQGGTRGT
jgi:predicted RNA-binding protein YlxR (DUF448 family)